MLLQRRGYIFPNNVQPIYCRACFETKYNMTPQRSYAVEDGRFHRCAGCGYSAAYPLWRDYRLWELDGENCRLITGMSYDDLRERASMFSDGEQDQNDPAWDAILFLSAKAVFTHRDRRT